MKMFHRPIGWQFLAAAVMSLAVPTVYVGADDFDACGAGDCCDDGEEACDPHYGPPACVPRKTLFQWSYGTSFSGGPPGPDEPLVTDRPDFTEASTTVGRGVVQLEMGYTYFYDREPGTSMHAHSYPEALWRIGFLADWLELRISYNHGGEVVNLSAPPSSFSATGSEDLYLGIKLGLTPQQGFLPEMALIPQMTVPTGDDAFTADEVLPGVNWCYGWDINDFLSTAGSSQTNRDLDGETQESYWEFAQSWTVGYSLSERLGAFTEWFAFFPTSADTEQNEHYFDGGFTFLVNNNIQLDARGGKGLNSAAIDYFLGSGISIRF